MSHHYTEIVSLSLTHYLVKVYGFENDPNNISQSVITSISASLENQSYPRGIVDALETLTGISKIEIFDINTNELLVTSFTPIENA